MKRHIVIPVVLAVMIGAAFLSGRIQIAAPATARAAASAAVALPAGTSSAEQMTARAKVFLAALQPEQARAILFPLDSNERGRWSNIPAFLAKRSGLRLGDLTENQRVRLHDLLRASMSSQGYLEVSGVMRMDQILRDLHVNPPPNMVGADAGEFWPGPMDQVPPFPDRGASQPPEVDPPGARGVPPKNDGLDFYISFFDTPDSSHPWAYLLTGHHLAASFTVSGKTVAFTPLFMGSQPFQVRRGNEAGWSPLFHFSERGLELMQSLSPAQQRVAWVSKQRSYQVMTGPGRRNSLGDYEGLKTSELTPSQQRLLRVLVEQYVRSADFDAAEAQLAAIEAAGWNNLWFSWRGPIGEGEFFYYRVHGPRLIIELAWEARNHVHTIVRDPANDYGEDWLGKHYGEQHRDMTATNEMLADYIRRGEEELERQNERR